MDAASLATLIPIIVQAVTGPGAALVVLVGFLVFLGYLLVKHLIPAMNGLFSQHKEDITRLLDAHREDRQLFESTVTKLSDGFAKVDLRLGQIEKSIDRIGDELDDIRKDCS